MSSSLSSFMELRNKRKFETSDYNEESKEISTTDVNANLSESTTKITMKSKKFNISNYVFVLFFKNNIISS